VPSAARAASFSPPTKSSTVSESSKCPTFTGCAQRAPSTSADTSGLPEMMPRIVGMIPAAISRRRSIVRAGVTTAPNGRLPRLFSVNHAVARLITSSVFS
jgi:hypothetical protein